MHPDLMLDLHRLHVQESLSGAEHHRHRHRRRRPRSPSRVRRDLAALLVYAAERLVDEPAMHVPRSTGRTSAGAIR